MNDEHDPEQSDLDQSDLDQADLDRTHLDQPDLDRNHLDQPDLDGTEAGTTEPVDEPDEERGATDDADEGDDAEGAGSAVDAVADESEDENADEGRASKVERLESEGDIAADYLEELLDIADLDGDLDMDVEGDRAVVSIVGADLSQLVGRDGEVLEALQELTRLAVYRETGERSRLMLDVSGHRAAAPPRARGGRGLGDRGGQGVRRAGLARADVRRSSARSSTTRSRRPG